MGLTYINGNATGASGNTEPIRFLVDSGSSFSLLPHATWTRLKLTPEDEFECSLVDGSLIRRKVADCKLSLLGKNATTRVILGEPGDDEALLGALTLEQLGLVLDPFSRTLKPMRVRL